MTNARQAQLKVCSMMFALAMVAATATAVRAATASWDPNTEPDLAGYKLSYGTQPGVYTVVLDVGNVTTYTLNLPAGLYYVVVQAYNTAGKLSVKSAEVTLNVAPNRAPTLQQPANQTSLLNANVVLALSASDPDGTPLSFSASGLPPGLSMNSISGVIDGIALAMGTYQVTVTASDGSLAVSRNFSWTVIDNNSAPIVLDVRPLDTTLMLSDDNTSAAEWLMAQTSPANRVASAILLKFNLSKIPANATIQSATLNLWLTGADADPVDQKYRMSLHQITGQNPNITSATGKMANGASGWTANQCCTGGFPLAQADISPERSATVVNRTPGVKVWNATAVARAWLAAPASNYGLLLNADTSKGNNRSRTFASAQDPVAAQRPFLSVTYTVPVTLPSSMTLATLAADTPAEESYLRVEGDFDGDGYEDFTTYRAGEWRIWTSTTGFVAPILVKWGEAGDVPVAGDFDSDGKTDLGLSRAGGYEVLLSSTSYSTSVRVKQ